MKRIIQFSIAALLCLPLWMPSSFAGGQGGVMVANALQLHNDDASLETDTELHDDAVESGHGRHHAPLAANTRQPPGARSAGPDRRRTASHQSGAVWHRQFQGSLSLPGEEMGAAVAVFRRVIAPNT